MAPKRRIGGDSYIFAGRQLKYGTPIIGEDVFDGAAPTKSLAKLIRNHFVFTRNTLDPTAEETESESITGGAATADSIISKRAGAGEWEFELLPDDAIHLLLGWFNPTELPTNTKVEDQAIPAAAVSIEDTTTVAIDNEVADAVANWPGQLKMKLTGASGAGKIRVYGQKRGSRSNNFNTPISEDVTVADGTSEVLSTNFYHRADKLVMSGFSTAPTGVALTFLPDTKWAKLALNTNNNPFDGWTAQMIKALLPYIAYNIIPNLFRLSIGANIRLLLGLLASYCQEARSLADPTVETNILANLRTDDGILSKYPRKALNFYPSLGTAVVLGEPDESLSDLVARIDGDSDDAPDPIAVTSVDIEGNHNYVDDEGFTGDPLAGQPVTSETETRTVTVNASIYHETDDAAENNETVHWQDIYFAKRKVPIVIRNYNWLPNGRQVLIESRFPRCGLTAVPGLPIEGRGSVTRNLAFEAKPSVGSTTPDEISMLFYSEKGFEE